MTSLRALRSGALIAAVLILMSTAGTLASSIGGGGIIRDVTIPTDQLHFSLGTSSAFVRTTTDHEGNEVAEIDLSAWWDALPQTTGLIDNFNVQICFDPELLEFEQDSTQINGDNWHGTLTYIYGVCGDGTNTKVALNFEYPEGQTHVDVAQTTPTVYATLRFRPKCQAGGSIDDLTLSTTTCSMRFVNVGVVYVSESLDNGAALVRDDYTASFVAPDYYSECSLLGETIEVPVKLSSDFRGSFIRQRIVFDNVRLTFNEAILSSGDLAWAEPVQSDGNSILLQIEPSATGPGYIAQGNDQELYRLRFTVTDLNPWSGPYPVANVSFDQADCGMDVYYDGGTCADIVPIASYDGAGVWSEFHVATLQVFADPNNYLLANLGDEATVIVAMKSNFPAGGQPDGIQFSVNTGDLLSEAGIEPSLGPDVIFETGTFNGLYGSNDEVYAHEYGDGVFPCSPTDSIELITFDVESVNGFYDAQSFDDRYVNLTFQEVTSNGLFLTQVVEDVTNTVYTTAAGHVAFVSGGPEVPVAEFSTTNATTDLGRVKSDLRVRNNFPMTSVQITVHGVGMMELTCVKPKTTGGTVTDNGNGTWTIVVDDLAALAPGGDGYKLLASCYFMPTSCTPRCEQRYGSASFVVDNITTNGTYTYKTFTSFGSVSANCCGTVGVDPCHDDAVHQKVETGAGSNLLPDHFALNQNHPNPFNPTTVISYDVPTASHVRLTIYNVLGQQVDVLVDREMAPGRYDVEWDASQLASGVYLYRMEADDFVETKKMLLMK